MPRLPILTGAIFLVAWSPFAQAQSPVQCQQVRQAVAQYGYAAARRHALATYGPEAVRSGDQCFSKHRGTQLRTSYKTHYRTRHRVGSG